MQTILHTDGGSRGNPGPSGIGFVLMVDDGRGLETLSEGGAFIGKATNNEAEYKALLWGLQNAYALGVHDVSIRSDSELLVKQIKGEYRVKSEVIKPLFLEVLRELRAFDAYEISHVYREDNSRADALANEAMDMLGSVGSFQAPCSYSASAPLQASMPETQKLFATDKLIEDQQPTVKDEEKSQSKTLIEASRRSKMSKGYYTLTVKDHFDAAHALVGYPGECRQLHGHTWDIEVSVSGTELDEVGIVYDFKSLKADLSSILNEYDHVFLNEIPPFDHINATAENLARVIYERLEAKLPATIKLCEVGVWESPIAKLTYRKE